MDFSGETTDTARSGYVVTNETYETDVDVYNKTTSDGSVKENDLSS